MIDKFLAVRKIIILLVSIILNSILTDIALIFFSRCDLTDVVTSDYLFLVWTWLGLVFIMFLFGTLKNNSFRKLEKGDNIQKLAHSLIEINKSQTIVINLVMVLGMLISSSMIAISSLTEPKNIFLFVSMVVVGMASSLLLLGGYSKINSTLPDFYLIDKKSNDVLNEIDKYLSAKYSINTEIKFYWVHDNDITVTKSKNTFSVIIGDSNFAMLNSLELKAYIEKQYLITAKFLTKDQRRTLNGLSKILIFTERSYGNWLFYKLNRNLRLVTASIFSKYSSLILNDANNLTIKSLTKAENSQYLKSAFIKKSMFKAYAQDERCSAERKLFASNLNVRNIPSTIAQDFKDKYQIYKSDWETELRGILNSKNYADLNNFFIENNNNDLAVQFDEMPNDMAKLFEKIDSDYYTLYSEKIAMGKEAYADAERRITTFENNMDKFFVRFDLIEVAEDYIYLGELERAKEIYTKLFDRGDKSTELLMKYGELLVMERNDKCIDYILKAMENSNHIHEGLHYLYRYYTISNNQEKLNNFENMVKEKIELSQKQLDRDIDAKKAVFNQSTLTNQEKHGILEHVKMDNNISKIYLADANGETEVLEHAVLVSCKNLNDEMLDKCYRRMFSYLDNELEEKNTFLIMLDQTPEFNELLNGDEFLLYDVKENFND